jgi:hypothetical protein
MELKEEIMTIWTVITLGHVTVLSQSGALEDTATHQGRTIIIRSEQRPEFQFAEAVPVAFFPHNITGTTLAD